MATSWDDILTEGFIEECELSFTDIGNIKKIKFGAFKMINDRDGAINCLINKANIELEVAGAIFEKLHRKYFVNILY